MADKDPDPTKAKLELLDKIETITDTVRSIAVKVDTGLISKERVKEAFKIGAAGLMDILEEYNDPDLVDRILPRFLNAIHSHGGPKGPEYADAFEQAVIEERQKRAGTPPQN